MSEPLTAVVRQGSRGKELFSKAEAALEAEDLSTAIEFYRLAENEGEPPDRCAGGRWMTYMLDGEFEAAWQESDAIRRRGAPDPHRFWNGDSLKGKRVMLRSLHGFGDAVQMFRFLPRLGEQVASLVVEVPPRLVELAPYFRGLGELVTWGPEAPVEPPAWDVQMEVMELPYALRVQAETLEPTSGYLSLPEPGTRLPEITRPRVGVVWAAGEWNPERSIPLGTFRALLDSEAVEFWSLQGGEEQGRWPGEHDASLFGNGIVPLAQAIRQMDLVITVDTLAAHLAGALAVPCWVLLQHRADWRWMSRRPDSPWYPSLRLFRQTREGGWPELLGRVRDELRTWVQRRVESENGVKKERNFASLGRF